MDFHPHILSSRRHLAVVLMKTLQEKGFLLEYHGDASDFTKEMVFTFPVLSREYMRVVVYTSIVKSGETDFEVRESGEDAIRVLLLYRREKDRSERAIYKATRINRTGDTDEIVGRVLERAREAYRASRHPQRCHRCGAPTYITKKGARVCAESCSF